jgi:hypothetical protein
MFVMCRFRYAAVEKAEYRAYTGSTTTRQALSTMVRKIHDDLEERVRKELRNASITLAADGWTDLRQGHDVNVVGLTEQKSWFLKVYAMQDGDTGAEISKKLGEAINYVAEAGGRVCAVVTDNAANMKIA